MPDVSLGLVLLVASASIFGPLSGWLAGQRSRSIALWGIFGVILGPIAPGLLLSAPPGRCAACRWPVAGWAPVCLACGADVRTGVPVTLESESPASPSVDPVGGPVTQPAESPPLRRRRRTPDKALPVARPPATPAASGQTRRRARRDAPPLTIVPGLNHEPAPSEHDWTPRVPATRLGRRPADAPAVRPEASDPGEAALAILGSGVYVGGNRPIEAGNRYLLARVAGELQILGPVHLDPGRVADRVPIQAIGAFVLEGRLVIDGRDAKTDISMAFVSVSQEREVDIVAALSPPSAAASQQ